MVDETRVLRLLRAVADDMSVLRSEATADEARRADALWLRGVKYTFVTAIEAVVDIAQHLCASQGWGPPADNGDALRLLGAHDALPVDLAGSLRRAVGFRNVLVHDDVLVHDYAVVDDGVVIARLADLGDLERFVSEIAGWVRSH